MIDNLFQSVVLNKTITLKNRIIMAPLTRSMADDNLVPTKAMAEYYAKRAGTGLIISEAVIIRPDGQGYPNTPGIFTKEQIAGWQEVTKAVHAKDGKIFAQLWHTGRLAHPCFFKGKFAVAPSAIAVEGTLKRSPELKYTVPKALSKEEILVLIEDYKLASKNAIEAGFDGVEIHGANGYLIDQFLHYSSNERDDEYGKTPENMSSFALAVVDAIIEEIGEDRTALRLSPGAYHYIQGDKKDRKVFDYLLKELEKRNLAFLHLGIFDDSMQFDYLEGSASAYLRKNYNKTLVGVGNYSAQTGSKAISEGKFDLLAIGRPLIANPDFVEKIKNNLELKTYSVEMLNELI